MKKLLLLMMVFSWSLAVRGQSREEIKELLTNSYNYMANGSFVLEDISDLSSDAHTTYWGSEGRYLLYNGACLWETVRSNNRLRRILTAAPPAFGSWWWQSGKDTPGKAVKNTIIFLPMSTHSWLTMVYNMLLEKRFDSAQYTLSETEVNGIECYTLTAQYPNLSQVLDCVPFNHINLYEEVEQFFDEQFKGINSAPVLTENEWYFPEEFIVKNLEELRPGYYAAISLTFAKDFEHPAIYGIAYYSENGDLVSDKRFGRVTPMSNPAPVFNTIKEAITENPGMQNFGFAYAIYNKPQSEEPEIVHPVTVARYIHLLYILLAVIIAAIIVQQVVKRLKNRKSA